MGFDESQEDYPGFGWAFKWCFFDLESWHRLVSPFWEPSPQTKNRSEKAPYRNTIATFS